MSSFLHEKKANTHTTAVWAVGWQSSHICQFDLARHSSALLTQTCVRTLRHFQQPGREIRFTTEGQVKNIPAFLLRGVFWKTTTFLATEKSGWLEANSDWIIPRGLNVNDLFSGWQVEDNIQIILTAVEFALSAEESWCPSTTSSAKVPSPVKCNQDRGHLRFGTEKRLKHF